MEFLHFVHCLSIVTRVLKFVDGRELFPIEAEGVVLTPSNIVVAIMNLLNPTICHHGPTSFLLRYVLDGITIKSMFRLFSR